MGNTYLPASIGVCQSQARCTWHPKIKPEAQKNKLNCASGRHSRQLSLMRAALLLENGKEQPQALTDTGGCKYLTSIMHLTGSQKAYLCTAIAHGIPGDALIGHGVQLLPQVRDERGLLTTSSDTIQIAHWKIDLQLACAGVSVMPIGAAQRGPRRSSMVYIGMTYHSTVTPEAARVRPPNARPL